MRDTSVIYEEVADTEDAGRMRYDIVFVDDASYGEKTVAFLEALTVGKVVFFSSRDTGEEIGGIFDTVIKKPFLPSQIQHVVDDVRMHMPEETKEVPEDENTGEAVKEAESVYPLFDVSEKIEAEEPEEEETASDDTASQVLDSREIEQIKALLEEEDKETDPVDPVDEAAYEARKVEVITKKLEEDGLEILKEDEILSLLEKTPKKKKKRMKKDKKRDKKKQKKQKEEAIYTMEEALLAALENMKPKKIRQLLKGAEVTIRIRFKEEM
jgi:hypothetical protein